MSSINPELSTITADDLASLKPAVERLFGTTNRHVQRAVANYLQAPHSTMDDANLRLIAAAAPLFPDDTVATLIDTMERVDFDLPIAFAPLDALRQQMQNSLGAADAPARARLLKSLQHRNTFQVIELAPVDLVSEAARELVREELARVVTKDPAHAVAEALNNPYATALHAELAYTRTGVRQIDVALSRATITPAHILDDLVRTYTIDGNIDQIEYNVARNTSTGTKTLSAISTGPGDRQNYIAVSVAENTSTAPEDLQRLFDQAVTGLDNRVDGAGGIIILVAANPSTAPATLMSATKLLLSRQRTHTSFDWTSTGLDGLASNPSTPSDALDLIAEDIGRLWSSARDCYFRAGSVASHPNATISALVITLPHARWEQVEIALKRDDLTAAALEAMLECRYPPVLGQIARHPATSATTRKTLARHPDAYVSQVARAVIASERRERFHLPPKDDPFLVEPIVAGKASQEIEFWRKNLRRDPGRPGAFDTYKVLVDAGEQFGAGEVSTILAHADPHDATAFALTHELPAGAGVPLPAIGSMTRVAQALADGVTMAKTSQLRTWADMPASSPKDFNIPASARKLHGIKVKGLTAELITDSDRLMEVKRTMGNCLDTYIDRAHAGSVAVIVFEDRERHDTYAAMYNVVGNRPQLIQANARYNRSQNLPEGFEAALISAVTPAVRPPDVPRSIGIEAGL